MRRDVLLLTRTAQSNSTTPAVVSVWWQAQSVPLTHALTWRRATAAAADLCELHCAAGRYCVLLQPADDVTFDDVFMVCCDVMRQFRLMLSHTSQQFDAVLARVIDEQCSIPGASDDVIALCE
jgi:hypothetical protein